MSLKIDVFNHPDESVAELERAVPPTDREKICQRNAERLFNRRF
jgi:predicted TIM-barrel fold metal-dependent hydrolase